MNPVTIKKDKKMDVYELLEKQMIILIFVFGIGTSICGYLAYHYGQLKGQAAEREKKWTDDHPNVADFRLQFRNLAGKDLGFLNATLHFKQPNNADLGIITVISKEAGLYLPIGSYSVDIETKDYPVQKLDIDITKTEIGQRMWGDINLGNPLNH